MNVYFVADRMRLARACAAATALFTATNLFALTSLARADDQKSASATTHIMRPTIAVLGVGDLDSAGHTASLSTKNNNSFDMVTRSLAEEAITKSHAFRLYSRDLMTAQTKELKLNAEGWVDPASAQKFGKSVGIQSFLTVFVATGSIKRFQGQSSSSVLIPTSGEVVVGVSNIPTYSSGNNSSGNGGLLGKLNLNKKSDQSTPRSLMQATATIMCRFTRVETGERVTESYTGLATADGYRGDPHKVAAAAIQNAFDNFRLNLVKNRTQLEANITEIADGKAIVDMGQVDGVTVDMAFEVCEPKKVGSFLTYEHVCDARVADVHQNTALLELGEYKRQFLHSGFSEKDDKAKLVHPGFIIREKKM